MGKITQAMFRESDIIHAKAIKEKSPLVVKGAIFDYVIADPKHFGNFGDRYEFCAYARLYDNQVLITMPFEVGKKYSAKISMWKIIRNCETTDDSDNAILAEAMLQV